MILIIIKKDFRLNYAKGEYGKNNKISDPINLVKDEMYYAEIYFCQYSWIDYFTISLEVENQGSATA